MTTLVLAFATSASATGAHRRRLVDAEIAAARPTSARGTQGGSPAEVVVAGRENACRQVVDLAAVISLRKEVPNAVAATRVMVDEDDAERTSTTTHAARTSRHRPTSGDTETRGSSEPLLSGQNRNDIAVVPRVSSGRYLAGRIYSVPAPVRTLLQACYGAGAGTDRFAASGCNLEQTEHARQSREPGLVAHAGSMPTPLRGSAGGVGLLDLSRDTVSTLHGRDGL